MEFKSKEEYEQEKARWQSVRMQTRSPAGYEDFLDAESKFLNKLAAEERAASEAKESTSNKKSNQMKISGTGGDGKYYAGDTMKIDPDSAEFVGFDKVISGRELNKPGTKFAKKGKYKKKLSEIESKMYDKDGKLIIPKYDMPDRVKLSKEQKAANNAIDSQLDDNGFYKTDKIEAPTINKYKTDKKYKKAGRDLATRMGIPPGKGRHDGVSILKEEANRYDKYTGALKIPDFSLGSKSGQDLLKIGKKKLNTKGMRT